MTALVSAALACVMALLILLFTISSIARYYIKFTIFIVYSMVVATAPIPLMLLKPFSPTNALYPAAALRVFTRCVGLRWRVRGLQHVDNDSGAVVLMNHQSSLDLFALAYIWPLMSRCTVISKRALQYAAPFGTAAWLWGTVFIDRGAKSAHDALNKQTHAVRDQKRKLILFPEGTRSIGDRLLPFRKGAFHVALDAGAPVQPVVISKYHFLDDARGRFGSGDVIMSILPAIETAGLTKDDLESLMQRTYDAMQAEFTRISDETRARRAKAD